MTDQELNLAVAKLIGSDGIKACLHGGFGRMAHDSIPDFCNDLNAMHEAEKVLTKEQTREYTLQLNDRCVSVDFEDCFELFTHTTARQRAEALLNTLSKHEEVAT